MKKKKQKKMKNLPLSGINGNPKKKEVVMINYLVN